MIEQVKSIELNSIVCADNYCYYVALLLILHNTIKPALLRGNKIAPALEHLSIDCAAYDGELMRLIAELAEKARLQYNAPDSLVKANWFSDYWARIHRRIFDLIQADESWRVKYDAILKREK